MTDKKLGEALYYTERNGFHFESDHADQSSSHWKEDCCEYIGTVFNDEELKEFIKREIEKYIVSKHE